MSLLTPLGLLGLIGLIAWLIIYIIKPNYQRKIISTTYVWKRSLKYRKRRIPISKLRNILLIICQILSISLIAFALAQPFIAAEQQEDNEKIIILDASADMLTALDGGEDRFERAVAMIRETVDDVIGEGGRVSVILASNKPEFVVQRGGADFLETIYEKLDLLVDPKNPQCTYGIANIDGAMELAETVLDENPRAQVMLYTGTSYIDSGDVTVVNVSDINEWNCAILGAKAETFENYYEFTIDLASYGRDNAIEVYLDIYGVNDARETLNFHESVLCTQEMGTVTLTFGHDETRAALETNYIFTDIYSYEYAYIRIEHNDSLQCDNTMYLYGGTKPELKIQYYSANPNPFFASALRALRDVVDDRWDISLTEVRGNASIGLTEPSMEGFDVYIFEGNMPEYLPTDGLVVLANPDKVPSGGGFYLGREYYSSNEMFLEAGEEFHPLMSGITAENISVTRFTQITNFDSSYTPVLFCGNEPVMLAKNENGEKIIVMGFSLNMSNLPLVKEFPMMILNMLEIYVPSTIEDHLYEVHDTVELNARAPELEVEGPDLRTKLDMFPSKMLVSVPGVYTLIQTPISGDQVVENFYVKIPAGESNIKQVVDTLENPYVEDVIDPEDLDLIFWLALALVALLFCEWLLQLKEYF